GAPSRSSAGNRRFWGKQGLARVAVASAAWLVPLLVLTALATVDEHQLMSKGTYVALVLASFAPPLLSFRYRCDPPGALPTMIRTAVAAAAVHLLMVVVVAGLWFTHGDGNRHL